MKNFLGYNHIIKVFPSKNKSCLKGRNKLLHEGSNFVNNDFRDNFINCCAKTNWSKMPQQFRPNSFWDKDNKSLVKVSRHFLHSKNPLEFLNDQISKSWPEVLKKTSVEPISPGAL